ncbi:ABC transporter ATP-binding protein [Microbacterium aurum]
MIIADGAHVTYRVHAAGRRVGRESLLSVSAVRGGRELREVPALRGVTFTASEGETIGVVGHNGSGKSTLFRAMSGLIPTSQGQILARERPVLLGVNAALVPELSGENNIKLGLLALGFTAEEAAARVDEIADFAELNEFIYHPMRTYSSGMSARLKFAIASAKAHSILLIDEALAVGDRRFKAKSENRIRELRETAGLVMIVSHSVGSLKDTCSRVLWIHKGELRADGAAPEVIRDYVAWTKNPANIAVGAASAQKTKAAVNPSPVTPAEKQELAPVVAVPGESALERLLSDAAAAARKTNPP